MENRRAIGKEKEELAEKYLKEQGYLILEKNFYSHFGAKDGRYLVFLEVKYRRSALEGYPAEAVDKRKQQRICRTAQYYLYVRGFSADMPCRFDVVAIQGNEITLIKNAFGGI